VSRYHRVGDPVLVALGVERDAEGRWSYDTAWVDAMLEPRTYAMLDPETGEHVADLSLGDALAQLYEGRWVGAGDLSAPEGAERTH
jgi:hypothetical protein